MKIKGNILVRSAACILAAALMVPAGTVLADEAQGPGPELLVSDYDTVELKEVEEGKEHKEHKEIRSDDTSAEESGSAEQAPVPEDEADAAEVDLHFHVIVIDEAQEPGYFHTGLTQGSHCSECGDVIAAQQVIPARAYSEDLGYGSSGPDVYELQEALAELGFLTTEYSGYFGDATMEALTQFQIANGLDATGEPDPQTVDALCAADAPAAYSDADEEELSSDQDYEDYEYYDTLTIGMSGDDVYFLQAALYDLGYLEDEPDGSYGFYTMDAVAGFQADNGLEVTGDADAQVLFLLFGGGYGSAGSDEDSDEDYTEEQTQKHEPVSSNASLGQSIVDYAMGYIGVTPYVHAGNSLEEGTDCSGFVSLIFADFGIYAPRGSDDYQDMGNIDYEDLLPGDVVVYRYGGHVAIYAGDDMIVHCSNPETGTVYSDMWYDEPTAYVRLVF